VLRPSRRMACAIVLAVTAFSHSHPASAQEAAQPEPTQADVLPQTWALHLQATDILQYYPAFKSPFQGANSFKPQATTGNIFDATLYGGVTLWSGGEIWGNLELYQGYTPSNTLGAAGFINGDGDKLGRAHPYARIARVFIRQTFDLGGGGDNQDPDANFLAGPHTKDRLVVTIGKFNATDIFDANKYAHEPRSDFLNWSVITTGSFDYAADPWGFTYGSAAEWYRGDWTFRAGLFDLSIVPNNAVLTPALGQFQVVSEVERRFEIDGHPGAVRLAGFFSRGNMGRYDDAVALALETGQPADTALVRHYRTRPGAYLNIEQEVAQGVGVFARAGWTDGAYEAYEYTDIDRTVQAGVSISGARWGRRNDTIGAALAVNGLSSAGERYLNAGGLGILVGDGRLPHPGPEEIVEAYYSFALTDFLTLSLDDQVVDHPAYNRDRGPVNVTSLRLHLER